MTERIGEARRSWSRDELVVAFNLYCRIPFGKIHISNSEVIALAKLLGRSVGSVSWKLANFASLDPSLKARNISGASHGSRLEAEVWKEFSDDWEALAFESESLRIKMLGQDSTIPQESFPEGKTRETIARARVNQGFFRSAVLAAYNSTCCITGLAIAELLSASHIIPWSEDVKNRTNPRNGLCLNAIHDRAFDRGLITITSDYKVQVSSILKMQSGSATQLLLNNFDGRSIQVPRRFSPDPTMLEYHQRMVFRP